MNDMPENRKPDTQPSPAWRKRVIAFYVALMVAFYLLHINFLTHVEDIPQAEELLTSHDWTWYYPALGMGSVLIVFAIARIIGFGLKRKTNYWEEH